MKSLSVWILNTLLVLAFVDLGLFGAAFNDFNLVPRQDDAIAYFRQPESSSENARSSKFSGGNCHLSEKWKGKWFQSGIQSPIIIGNNKITTKGDCVESSGDKYLFVENQHNGRGHGGGCYRCLVINDRHDNVLQYKESLFCEDKNNLEFLCSQITGDAQLYSLFRIDGVPDECPFRGAPFTFTYSRGYGECKNPVSHVDTCTENSKLLLRYQACPDVQKTESLEEELQCIAQWRDGSQLYLVGKVHHRLAASNEDSYRCFVYEKIKGHSLNGGHATSVGYRVGQSGDATCTGVTSSQDGARTMTLHRVEHSDIKCKFPAWLAAHRWHTLDGKLTARFHHKNSSLHLTDESRKNSTAQQNLIGGHGFGGHGRGGNVNWFTGGSRIFCQNKKDHSDSHVSILARHVNGCQSKMICMQIYKRDSHVVEVKIRAREDDSECDKGGPEAGHGPFVTLVSTEAAVHRCPYLGKYTATSVTQDGRGIRDACGPTGGQNSFNTLIVGCGDRAKMEFHSKCPSQEPTTIYSCHGHWEENGLGFLIATPMSRSSTAAHRYCFVYTESAEGSLRVYSSSESCRRNINAATESTWAFNLTSDGQCAEAVTAGGASGIKSCDSPVHNVIYVIVVLLISLLSNTLVSFIFFPTSSHSDLTREASASVKTGLSPKIKELSPKTLNLHKANLKTFKDFTWLSLPRL